jgi:hypothetical protein
MEPVELEMIGQRLLRRPEQTELLPEAWELQTDLVDRRKAAEKYYFLVRPGDPAVEQVAPTKIGLDPVYLVLAGR